MGMFDEVSEKEARLVKISTVFFNILWVWTMMVMIYVIGLLSVFIWETVGILYAKLT